MLRVVAEEIGKHRLRVVSKQDGALKVGVPDSENFIGIPGMRTLSPAGRGTFTTMSRASTWQSPRACPMITDVVSGQVPMLFTGVLGPLPFLKAAKLKAIAIGSRQRSPMLPNAFTFAESGYPEFEAEVSFGAFLPAKVPQCNRGGI